MLAFAGMLTSAAEKAGIKVPEDADNFDQELFPHFHLFCAAQLGQPMPYMGCHWENAFVIARIPADKIKTVTWKELEADGFQVGYPIL